MRRFVYLVAFIVVLGFTSTAWATTIGGLGYNVGTLNISADVGVGIFQRDIYFLKDDSMRNEETTSRLAAKISFGPWRIIDFYALGGAGDLSITGTTFRAALGPYYGGGLRLQVFPWNEGEFRVALDGNVTGMHVEDEGVRGDWWEYQAALIISKTWQNFTPFGGVKYSDSGVHFKPGGSNNVRSDQNVGVFLGVDYFITPFVFFNGEIHVFAETAAFVGVGYRYR
ncbi:MAG: hypothetical protein P9M14_01390 [Candidatus Alcyoniella australis]|nr:hypothetical protein [Candidatus Alcyoniella australis]